MPKHTRIYTRTGDDGTTGLIGGGRVRKNAPRIEAYGNVDELSSVIGLVRAALSAGVQDPAHLRLDAWLAWTQDILFNLGCELATPTEQRGENMPHVALEDATTLERAIDEAERDLPVLANFIHPGGGSPGALLHLARTVARRAERSIEELAGDKEASSAARRYINRLSDALFVWSRQINHLDRQPEHLWNPKAIPPPITPS